MKSVLKVPSIPYKIYSLLGMKFRGDKICMKKCKHKHEDEDDFKNEGVKDKSINIVPS